MKTRGLFILIMVLWCCKYHPKEQLSFLEGYWEIVEVKQNGKRLKHFDYNTSIDYFKLKDSLSGFRKKVVPSFDGHYNASKHKLEFQLKSNKKNLQLVYVNVDSTYTEYIIKLTKDILAITNEEGLTYHYKSYKPLLLK